MSPPGESGEPLSLCRPLGGQPLALSQRAACPAAHLHSGGRCSLAGSSANSRGGAAQPLQNLTRTSPAAVPTTSPGWGPRPSPPPRGAQGPCPAQGHQHSPQRPTALLVTAYPTPGGRPPRPPLQAPGGSEGPKQDSPRERPPARQRGGSWGSAREACGAGVMEGGQGLRTDTEGHLRPGP